jgi:hypothetical protein
LFCGDKNGRKREIKKKAGKKKKKERIKMS